MCSVLSYQTSLYWEEETLNTTQTTEKDASVWADLNQWYFNNMAA